MYGRSMRWALLGLTLLLLSGILLLLVGVSVAVETMTLCGFGSDCAYYLIFGIDRWIVAFGTVDVGGLAVAWSVTRISKRIEPMDSSG